MSSRSAACEPRECIQCLYDGHHPFGLQFNEEGLCTGCSTHSEKFSLDWEQRFSLLEKRISAIKGKNKFYDCIIPIRGTPEYFYVVDVVKNRLGLNPLAVSYNSQFNSLLGIKNFARIKEVFDIDTVSFNTNPLVYRKLVRESLVRFGHLRWPYLAGETAFAVRVAIEKEVPLIIWPLHQPTEQVGMHSYLDEPEMSKRSWIEHDLIQYDPSKLAEESETLIRAGDVYDIVYPENRLIAKGKIVGIYLSNYLPWDSRRFSEEMVRTRGALSAKNARTFDTYDRIDDLTYMGAHDLLKFANLGYSRVTDNLNREIRFGRIDKSSAKGIETFYQAQYEESYLTPFLEWVGMTPEAFSWFIKFSKFGMCDQNASAPLDAKQRSFIDSFISNHAPVFERQCFTLYGKGLAVGDEL
ncbi:MULTISPECIES: N-acetyl sugar amidotransferase [unclassified Thiocapsa]|uniref:N-acetyl sugar amidotransferase n=1 Tax=unclassified Thiocapsa TaxID=2641286 RepID=UPI0035AF6537